MSSKKPLAYEAYQKLADAYADRIDTKPHNAYYDKPAMLALLPDVDGKRVLDAGCGPGAYAESLLNRGAIVDCCDASDRMLELAVKRLQYFMHEGRVRVHNLDLTKPLDVFGNAMFDVVNAPLCLDYIDNWTKLFKEFNRVLKPGGTFLFSAAHPSFDAEYFKSKNYFSVEQVKSIWRGFGIHVEMPGYRRSLEEALNPVFEAGFIMNRFVEPQPTDDFRKTDLKRYLQLKHRPSFMCVRATKPE